MAENLKTQHEINKTLFCEGRSGRRLHGGVRRAGIEVNFENYCTEEGEWNYRGRPLEKSFLYDIVSNSIDSVDVDKFDYLLRDSHHAAIAIPFNQNSVMRLMDWMRPLEVTEELSYGRLVKYSRICYAIKVCDDVDSVGQSRYALHEKIYSHHTVRAYEYMISQALMIADRYLLFKGDDQRMYALSGAHRNMAAFMRTDDSVIQMIENSSLDGLAEPRRILSDLKFRRLPKLVGSTTLRDGDECTQDEVKSRVYGFVDKSVVSADDFFVSVRVMHRGMGTQKHPMSEVLFYNHKAPPQEMEPFRIDRALVRVMHRGMGTQKHPMSEVLFYNHKAPPQEMEPFRIDRALLKHKSPTVGGSKSVMVYLTSSAAVKSSAKRIASELFNAIEKFSRDGNHEKPIARIRRSRCRADVTCARLNDQAANDETLGGVRSA
ncbi:Deoxynucleoside triphosphate triphosphohydrolase SAMHD1 [Toxocara canis]|uniref:Deoxynucleoside triphosphate triphosphohydrolase SAMHD1 n=1 Tax=Toxocara canis TaxID=6265 RepID=A0A0B2VBJ5_TOXCA|nr:Deoxynucleoside triphosphate triphosphohydrolase SAMHD1 [Toxocara canis]